MLIHAVLVCLRACARACVRACVCDLIIKAGRKVKSSRALKEESIEKDSSVCIF